MQLLKYSELQEWWITSLEPLIPMWGFFACVWLKQAARYGKMFSSTNPFWCFKNVYERSCRHLSYHPNLCWCIFVLLKYQWQIFWCSWCHLPGKKVWNPHFTVKGDATWPVIKNAILSSTQNPTLSGASFQESVFRMTLDRATLKTFRVEELD